MKDRCENCRFWRAETFPNSEFSYPDVIEGPNRGTGLCLRFPPTISKDAGLEFGFEDDVLGKEAFFPMTAHNAWCGEHQPKEK